MTSLMTTPTIEMRDIAPIVVLLVAACLGVLVEALMTGKWRRWRDEVQMALVLGSTIASFIYVILNARKGLVGPKVMGSLMVDGPTYVAWGLLLVFGLFTIMTFRETRVGGGVTAFASVASAVPGSLEEEDADRVRLQQTEVYPLALFSLAGMMTFVAAGDLLTLFVALEVFSLPLYIMSGMARRRRLMSQEAALKYFLLGAFSSAIFLFGIAMLYAFSGSLMLSDIAVAVAQPVNGRGLLYIGLLMVAIGLLFKIGAVPFHNWTPDVYTGAPTPVTGFMAICVKLAAVVALLRVFYVALGGERWTWQPLFAIIAILTMFTGAIVGLTQKDVKRMLAYSSITHAGFILTAVVGASQDTGVGRLTSVSAIAFYLAAYGLATIGAFALIPMVRNAAGEDNSFAAWSGVAKKSPLLAGLMSLFLLSFAGIPLTAGFIGKWTVFSAAWRGGYSWLVVVAIVAALISMFFYLRLISVMVSGEPAKDTVVAEASAWSWIPVIVGAVGTLVLGLFPDVLMSVFSAMGNFLH